MPATDTTAGPDTKVLSPDLSVTPPDLSVPLKVPKPSDPCAPGTRLWCDGDEHWGTVICKADSTWPTANGLFDCVERTDDRRPATDCACYHSFFTELCCERADCVIPEGTDGQLCPPSGGKLCDPCDVDEQACGAGICVLTSALESFCTVPCGSNDSCPEGYFCMNVKHPVTSNLTKQCIPKSFTCWR